MLNEVNWLISDEGQRLLSDAMTWQREHVAITTIAKRLREKVTSEFAQAVMTTVSLRLKAQTKFRLAEQMLLTTKGLQQATSESIGKYKSSRFEAAQEVFDLCCGIGGDLLSLGSSHPVHGIDQLDAITEIARYNARTVYRCEEVRSSTGVVPNCLDECHGFLANSLWHLDPDRRSNTQRTVTLAHFSPSLEQIEKLREIAPQGAIKVAPASQLPEEWISNGEREFIGEDDECKQQMIWFGDLATQQNSTVATLIGDGGTVRAQYRTETTEEIDWPVEPSSDEFLYEPHSVLSAARLVRSFAADHSLRPICPGHEWLSSHQKIQNPLITCFRKIGESPLRESKIKSLLDHHRIDRIECKIHGLRDAQPWLKWKYKPPKLSEPQLANATLLLTRIGDKRIALLCERMPSLTKELN